jgi:CRISPR-associated protein Cmr3
MNKGSTRWYQLEPVDAWFFRDGRPSNYGEDQNDLESQFPPNASTVVGACRAALAGENGWDGRSNWDSTLKALLGDGYENLGQLAFTGPLLMRRQELLFPMPAHVLGRMNEDFGMQFEPCDWLEPSENLITCDMGEIQLPSRMGLSQTKMGEKEPSSAEGFFVNTSGMTKILNGDLPSASECFHRSQLFCLESRVGIERDDKTRSNKEGAIYSPGYIRLEEGVSLAIGVKGLPDDWNLPAYFPLGGESRLAACESIEPPAFPIQQTDEENSILLLVTPGCFASGNWWGAGPEEGAEKLASNLVGKVTTAIFDRPLGIGGWNSLKGQPLPMRPFVKPGAVWWIHGNNTIADSPNSILPIGECTDHGYGLTFLGKQPIKNNTHR